MFEEKRPLKVFISYSSQDRPLVQELSRQLVGEGWIDTWLDVKKLLPGQDWRVNIEDAVEDADIVIICLSNHSVTKEGYVQKELRYAREIALEKPEEAIFLIPLRLDECEVPRGLRFYQWVDYFGENKDKSYSALVESLKLRYEQKLRLEEAERTRKEKLEAERIAREEAVQEKAKKDAEEKARLEAEEQVRLKTEKEKAERETAEKLAREKEEREAAEKVAREKAEREAAEKEQLKAENNARQKAVHEKTAREKKERESAERVVPQKSKRETTEKPKPKTVKPKLARKTSQVEPNATETQLVQRNSSTRTFWGIGIIAFILVISMLALNNWKKPTAVVPTSTRASSPTITSETIASPTKSFTSTPEIAPTDTIVPTSTKTQTPAPTVTLLPTEITDVKGVTMRLVPAGEFTMGSNNGSDDEKPVHQVYLDAFYMDIYEVTNAAYKACVDAGGCIPPYSVVTYNNPSYQKHPVTFISWNRADAYCEWRGASLPTEAQWEKAARGDDGRTYPWGEVISCGQANYYNGSKYCAGKYTTEVGTYQSGKSPYGMYDMAGNVWEWVADWYDAYPGNTVSSDYFGTKYRVLRGGSRLADDVRSANRSLGTPNTVNPSYGFRCARSIP